MLSDPCGKVDIFSSDLWKADKLTTEQKVSLCFSYYHLSPANIIHQVARTLETNESMKDEALEVIRTVLDPKYSYFEIEGCERALARLRPQVEKIRSQRDGNVIHALFADTIAKMMLDASPEVEAVKYT